MAALNFPTAPTVGQQYAGTNGVTYTWDGETWTASGGIATGIAGGDLTGTYPAPSLAAGAAVSLADFVEGPAATYTATGTAEVLVTNKTETLTGNHVSLLFGLMRIEVTKITATVATVTVTGRLRIGGTTTGLDGTIWMAPASAVNLANGNRVSQNLPLLGYYTPAVAGAVPFKLTVQASDITNYTIVVSGNAAVLNFVELA